MSEQEKRRHERIPISVEVELSGPGLGTMLVPTQDLSEGGVFLCLPRERCPPVGTVIQMRINRSFGDGDPPPTVAARVMRVTAEGAGVMFLPDGDSG
jgi:hypothetical protein